MVFSQNAYVLNGSSSSHKLSQQYDDAHDVVRNYVDGTEKLGPQMVPDYDNAVNILYWNYQDSWASKSYNSIYTVPSNGYILIYDCANTRDYSIWVNIANRNDGNILNCAYHKCGVTNAANGFFPVAKGDVIYMSLWDRNSLGNTAGRTVITFLPGKITAD